MMQRVRNCLVKAASNTIIIMKDYLDKISSESQAMLHNIKKDFIPYNLACIPFSFVLF